MNGCLFINIFTKFAKGHVSTRAITCSMEFDMMHTTDFFDEDNREFFDYIQQEDRFPEETEVFREFQQEEEMFARIENGLNALEKSTKRKRDEEPSSPIHVKKPKINNDVKIAYEIAKRTFLVQYDGRLEKMTQEIFNAQPLHMKMTTEDVDRMTMSKIEAKGKLAKAGLEKFPTFDAWKKTYQQSCISVISDEEEEPKDEPKEDVLAKLEKEYARCEIEQNQEMLSFHKVMTKDQELLALDINNRRDLTEDELLLCLSKLDKKNIIMQCLMGKLTSHHARYTDYYIIDCIPSTAEPKKRFVLLK